MKFQTSGSRFVLREALLVAIAAAASFAFLVHGLFYMDGRPSSTTFRLEPFLFITALAYLFLRFVVLAIELRPPRMHAELVRCPTCGQWMDDVSAKGVAAHAKVDAGLEPTKKEVVPAVALRRAVEAMMLPTEAPDGREADGHHDTLPAVENLTSRDLVAALDDPDFLDRAGPRPPAPEGPRTSR